MKTSRFTPGFSLLEVLVALAIFSFTALALLGELNASLQIVGRQQERLKDGLVATRGLNLLELEAKLTSNDQEENAVQSYPVRFPTLPWVDEELEKVTPRSQTETIVLPIEGFPQMLKTTVWLETRDRAGNLETVGSRITLTEDPKVMENYKKLLESGKEADSDDSEDTPKTEESLKSPVNSSLAPSKKDL